MPRQRTKKEETPSSAKTIGEHIEDAARAEGAEVAEPANALERGTARVPKARFSGMPGNWEAVQDALPVVTAVRTVLPSLNLATLVGGAPGERILTVHGPTHGGKTAFIMALVASFLLGGHAAAYVDAEHAMDINFVRKLVADSVGVPLEKLPGFMAKRPATYEEVIAHVNELLKWAKAQREQNDDFRLLLVVDSVNKLTPKRELDAILKQAAGDGEGDGGGGGGKGRHAKDKGDQVNKGWGRMRAAMNQAWLDHLVPRLAAAGCTLVLIAQERKEQVEKMPWETDLMDEYEIKGGDALKYDASLLLRVTKVAAVKDGDGKDAPTLAWKHNVRMWKSKVGAMQGRWTDAAFFIRLDGTLDLERNLIATAKELGVVVKPEGSSWHGFGGKRVNGEPALVKLLQRDKPLRDQLIAAVNEAVDKECKKRQAVQGPEA